MSKRRAVAGIAGAVALLAVGVGVVMAQSDENGVGPSFLDRVAEKLGIETGTLQQAFEDARNDEIDAAVERGDLTAEEGQRLKERLADLPADAPFVPGPLFGAPGRRADGFGFGFKLDSGKGFGFGLICPGLGLAESQEEIAGFLGTSTEQLAEELSQEGATLTSVAEAHGKTREELKAFLEGKLRERLDAAVADGSLTRERADEILGRSAEVIDRLLDQPLRKPFSGEGMPFRRFSPEDGNEDVPGQRFEIEEYFSS